MVAIILHGLVSIGLAYSIDVCIDCSRNLFSCYWERVSVNFHVLKPEGYKPESHSSDIQQMENRGMEIIEHTRFESSEINLQRKS